MEAGNHGKPNELLKKDGRVIRNAQAKHQNSEGWLKGYLINWKTWSFQIAMRLSCHIIDSMFNQHAKWLKVNG